MVTRKLRELTDSEEPNDRGDIQRIADTYRAYAEGRMEAEKGFAQQRRWRRLRRRTLF